MSNLKDLENLPWQLTEIKEINYKKKIKLKKVKKK